MERIHVPNRDKQRKWYSPQRNAQVGDIVLVKEKNSKRLSWPTATILSVTTDRDGLVRRVKLQPHKLPGKTNTPQAKERAIHDLVLLKAITAKDNPSPDSTTSSKLLPEARVLLSSIAPEDRKMFWNDQTERTKNLFTEKSTPCSLQTPNQLIEQPQITEEEVTTIQNTASAFINKIHRLR